ncbi:hypothetical protein DIPPA_20318 [Diplonema papillatum]|nr:hypothetical protein DIPPA_20318 [Diplonema papillatum]
MFFAHSSYVQPTTMVNPCEWAAALSSSSAALLATSVVASCRQTSTFDPSQVCTLRSESRLDKYRGIMPWKRTEMNSIPAFDFFLCC